MYKFKNIDILDETIENALKAGTAVIVMPVGLPASGKSTLVNWLKDVFGTAVFVISRDESVEHIGEKHGLSYRESFVRGTTDKDYSAEIKAHYDAQIKRAYEKTYDKQKIIFWDRTNISKKTRAKDLGRSIGKPSLKLGIIFNISAQESKDRCKKRFEKTGKSIPEYAIDQMEKQLRQDYPREGEFDIALSVSNQNVLRRIQLLPALPPEKKVNKNKAGQKKTSQKKARRQYKR